MSFIKLMLYLAYPSPYMSGSGAMAAVQKTWELALYIGIEVKFQAYTAL